MSVVNKIFNIDLDLKQTTSNKEFEVTEGDTGNKIKITVTDDGSAVDLSTCRVLAIFSKTTGTSMQDSDAEDGGVVIGGTNNNEVTIDLFRSSFAPGIVECELQIYSGTNNTVLITSARFNFACKRGIFNADTAQATNEYPLLVGLIADCAAITEVEAARVLAEAGRVTAEVGRETEIAKVAGMTVNVTTLAAGSDATASLSEDGTDGHKILTLGIPRGANGVGTGDMNKSVYDTNNSGVVDNSEKLDGHEANYFSPADHNHDGTYSPTNHNHSGTYAEPAQDKTATLTVAGWSAQAPYTQTVNVADITAAMKPVVDIVLSDTQSTAETELIDWGKVSKIETGAGTITATCFTAVPAVALNLTMKVVG